MLVLSANIKLLYLSVVFCLILKSEDAKRGGRKFTIHFLVCKMLGTAACLLTPGGWSAKESEHVGQPTRYLEDHPI